MVDTNKAVEALRDYIRQEGFVIGVAAGIFLARYWQDQGWDDADAHQVLDQVAECDDIHRVEYTNQMAEDFRRKDLFYYNPGPL